MAMAFCIWCKRGANESVCPRCGGPMRCDEIYPPDEGGAYPMLVPRGPAPPPPRPTFFGQDADRQSRLDALLAEIEAEQQRPPTPLERAVCSIQATYGKGSISHAHQ